MDERRSVRVAVAGAAGGVGATTVACGLALAWAVERGLDPWLIDLDEARGDLAERWDLPDERTIADLATVAEGIGPDHLRRAAVTHRSGAVVLLAPPAGTTVPAAVVDGVLRPIERGSPVVLDVGSAQGAAARRAAERCSAALIVTPASTRGARLARRLALGVFASVRATPLLVVVSTPSDDLSAKRLARAVGAELGAVLPRSAREAAGVAAGEWPGLRRRGLGRPLLALADGIA